MEAEQFVTNSACHAGGRGFESRPLRQKTLTPCKVVGSTTLQGVLF